MELTELSVEEEQRFWELYVLDCERGGTHPGMSDFCVWLEER